MDWAELKEVLREVYDERMPGRRERIATAALQGLCAVPVEEGYTYPPGNRARDAVAMADALIAELDEEDE